MKKNEPIKMKLQLFAEKLNEETEVEEAEVEDKAIQEETEQEETEQAEKTYTEEELQKIIKDRIAREKKAAQKAVKEAEKLAKMNEDQKKQYELEKLKEELEEYKKKDAFYALSKEASKILSEHNIIADDEILQFVVKDTAEDTKKSVESFVSLIDAKVKEGVKKVLSGSNPKVKKSNNKAMTKAEIMSIKDTTERQKMIAKHIDLFK
ncbi:capsid assembly scaffolding protein Gp46 family protein [Garciella nitratireducens]|uniref:Uncharacterized protein n=1 Tax=Garciella nitratireducens DSM 15102 TaxID=1121911 RepID=A0A1T4K6S5_9FIRM|nr:DUF4355 domain-containing protein [Garciella nitratireducens]SJZ38005.1 protein of unknown function [Garciella nitratireducens DSM 15102]